MQSHMIKILNILLLNNVFLFDDVDSRDMSGGVLVARTNGLKIVDTRNLYWWYEKKLTTRVERVTISLLMTHSTSWAKRAYSNPIFTQNSLPKWSLQKNNNSLVCTSKKKFRIEDRSRIRSLKIALNEKVSPIIILIRIMFNNHLPFERLWESY